VRRRAGWLWVVAVVVTLIAAVWQRRSGPTYPVYGTVRLGGEIVRMRLVRSGKTGEPLTVAIGAAAGMRADVAWRRYPTGDPWVVVPMRRAADGRLVAKLPSQPPAGKVEYQVRLRSVEGAVAVFPARPAVARFKDEVPLWLLLPHVLCMFVGMLVAVRAGLESLSSGGDPRRLAWPALVLLALGGLLLGPAVQKLAFGAWWTGFPHGIDLTDNKTVIAVLAWGWAVWRLRGRRRAGWAVVAATLVTLAVFSIPHSTWGSELRWDQVTVSD